MNEFVRIYETINFHFIQITEIEILRAKKSLSVTASVRQ